MNNSFICHEVHGHDNPNNEDYQHGHEVKYMISKNMF